MALVVGCGFFVFLYGAFEKTPDDALYRNLLSEFFSAHPIAINISPNGEYVLTKAELETGGFQIAVQDWKNSRVLFTNFSWNSQRSLTWRPDNKAIVFQETDGMDRPLYLWDFQSGKRKLNVPVSKTALPPLRWDPNGKRLAYFSGDWRKGRLLIIDPEGEFPPVVVHESISGTCDFVWSPDGRQLAIITASQPGIVVVTEPGAQNYLQIKVAPQGKVESLAWSKDGQSILVSARRENDEYFRLFVIDPSNGSVVQKAEAAGDLNSPMWLPGGKSFVYHILSDGIARAFLADQEDSSSKAIGPTNGVLRVTHASADGRSLYGRFASLSNPPCLIEISIETGDFRVAYHPPKNNTIRCPPPQSIRISSYDGVQIPAYHWVADKAVGVPRGVLIEVHGGLHTQTFPTWESYIQIMTKHGCDVIALNYRGSSGFGQVFEKSGDDYDRVMDIVAARDYAVNHLKVNPEKVFLMGNSRGSALIADVAANGTEIGGLVLVSWVRPLHVVESSLTRGFTIVGFHGEMDPYLSPKQARKSVEAYFSPATGIPIKKRWYNLRNEGHFFYTAKSHSTICWEILTNLGLGQTISEY